STLSRTEISTAIAASFGDGTEQKVQIVCKTVDSRTLIVELRINLKGPLTRTDLASALHGAAPRDPGCPGGEVDDAGF
ncbi:MAG: ribonuclease T, partial [Alphaproteobacteria bacterium]|nr:ribonuclease T [Alphaproteobacteria bacterium]